ncbi:hypothetical protein HOLleu_28810 [Holothuria leucospilota]|uniref:Uncharacterized protein n=1 Tax=Holothuria leucospilota TaxID=206669 RepID=A0A9Q1GYS1_HOLLE|nr:hypothetical protein HOLleu_28810 [Holothuria leucospilota]
MTHSIREVRGWILGRVLVRWGRLNPSETTLRNDVKNNLRAVAILNVGNDCTSLSAVRACKCHWVSYYVR